MHGRFGSVRPLINMSEEELNMNKALTNYPDSGGGGGRQRFTRHSDVY